MIASQRINTVFFDVETQRLADEVGGWHNVAQMGMAAAVTYSSESGAFRRFTEEQVTELVTELQSADLVVGFNVLRFDYVVLQPYSEVDLQRLPTVDMLEDIYRQLGFRVGLDSLAAATLGSSKLADGLQSVSWYKQGRIDDVLAYCQEDVKITRDLFEFGRTHKYLQFRDRSRSLKRVPVSW